MPLFDSSGISQDWDLQNSFIKKLSLNLIQSSFCRSEKITVPCLHIFLESQNIQVPNMEGRTISVYFSPPQYITMSLYHHSTTFLNHSLRLCENIKQELSLKTLEFEVKVLGVTVIYKECLHLGQVGAHLMPHHLEIISINANSLDLSCKMNSQPSKNKQIEKVNINLTSN